MCVRYDRDVYVSRSQCSRCVHKDPISGCDDDLLKAVGDTLRVEYVE